ncbi:hypothetical protein BZA05DRAFT_258780 [Tricharina praecox]|uniref:uncharacterized protein n=1 Tax=Tricharina praecox TaxID=43433 RepID=UPI00221FA227|nr:uncharacterized protein BZA05DRAFT_258780 [Tricharina praecox]KAI5854135.1 hypothetical protein BZA05DRAFT_258780 [Tricharina praecox]
MLPTSISFGDAPPPKSILKSSGAARRTPSEARKIALTHASTLQIRKSLELSILSSLTFLLDLPPPSAEVFKHHIRFFTPADYDGLLEERNILELCGYALCARPVARRRVRSRLARTQGGEWVQREQLERFCGEACRKRTLWVRVQLSEEAAWNRGDVVGRAEVDEVTGEVRGVDLDSEVPPVGWRGGVRLLEEEEGAGEAGEREKGWAGGEGKDVWKLAEDLKGVGIAEDGKGGVKGGVLADVVERRTEVTIVTLPQADDHGAAAAIEGYVPKAQRGNDKE